MFGQVIAYNNMATSLSEFSQVHICDGQSQNQMNFSVSSGGLAGGVIELIDSQKYLWVVTGHLHSRGLQSPCQSPLQL